MDEKEKNGVPAEIMMKTETSQAGDINQHIFEEMGRFVEMNGHYYIRFEESYDDGKVPVMVKITSDNRVHLTRFGDQHKTNLVFDSDQATYTKLNTPAGPAEIKVETRSLDIAYHKKPFSGQVDISYRLEMNGQKLGDYQIQFNFTT